MGGAPREAHKAVGRGRDPHLDRHTGGDAVQGVQRHRLGAKEESEAITMSAGRVWTQRVFWVSRDGPCGSKVDVWTGKPELQPGADGHAYYAAGRSALIVANSPLHNLSVDTLGYGECRKASI